MATTFNKNEEVYQLEEMTSFVNSESIRMKLSVPTVTRFMAALSGRVTGIALLVQYIFRTNRFTGKNYNKAT